MVKDRKRLMQKCKKTMVSIQGAMSEITLMYEN